MQFHYSRIHKTKFSVMSNLWWWALKWKTALKQSQTCFMCIYNYCTWSIFCTQEKRLPSTATGDFVWERGSSNTSGVPIHWTSRWGDYTLPASLLYFLYIVFCVYSCTFFFFAIVTQLVDTDICLVFLFTFDFLKLCLNYLKLVYQRPDNQSFWLFLIDDRLSRSFTGKPEIV